jgi:TM2 domain-containing membrane protein YozV
VASPGWYDDPGDESQERLWDGSSWTGQCRPRSRPPAGSPPAGSFPSGPGFPPPAGSFPSGPGFPPPAGPVQVAPKNPAVSLVISFFLPGVGSMVNGDVGTGVGILVLYVVGLVLTLVFVGIFVALGAWIWGLVDAYKGAQRWNARHGIVS